MSRDKQMEIVEMSKVVDEALTHNVSWNSKNGVIGFSAEGIARELIDEGYCKHSEVVREVFEDIERAITTNRFRGTSCFLHDIAELRKKYESEG